MTDVFNSYARSTEGEAKQIAEALRALGYGVWRDDELPAHRAYREVIEERLRAARAVVVIWSAEAVKSEWVRAEANVAREAGTLVQLRIDKAALPLPFNETQCADLGGWSSNLEAPGWRKVVGSIAELVGGTAPIVAPPHAAAPPVLPDKPSIAVLPFTNITGGKDGDYFSDGMVEEIVTALSRFPGLFVIASGSSLTYRDDARGPGQIARELGVRYILDGSVRRSGARVRIAVRLADAIEGSQVWAERFDGTLEDVFALQDEVATAVAGQIAPSIEAADIRRAYSRPTSDLTAYEFYLRAVQRERVFDRQMIDETLAFLDQALALDPTFARALAFASLIHSIRDIVGANADPQKSATLALDFARRAISADPDDPEVLAIASNVLVWAGEDIAPADAMVERAVARNPGASFPWFASAWVKVFDGRPALAIEHWNTHLRLDPRSANRAYVVAGIGFALVLLERFEVALTPLKEANQQLPNHPFVRVALAVVYARLGRLAEAASTLDPLSPAQIHYTLRLLRDPDHRELIRFGLALAGADV